MVTKVSRVSSTVSGRSSGCVHRKRKPTRNTSRSVPVRGSAGSAPLSAGRRNLTQPRLAAETRKVAPSTPSAQSAPTAAVMNPAATGPRRVPMAKVPISRPLAAMRSCLRTRFGTAVT